MSETDATGKSTITPQHFLPYIDKHRLYKLFRDMVTDLVIHLPRDHLKHMKMFVRRRAAGQGDPHRIVIITSPEVDIEITKVVKEMMKSLHVYIITRRCILDKSEKHFEYDPQCVSPELLAEVAKDITIKDPIPQAGWLMFDHPCSLREAQSLQQEGVLPTVTLALGPPQSDTCAVDHRTGVKGFFDQDFEGLKYAYRATLKEVAIEPGEDPVSVAAKCLRAILAAAAGLGPGGAGDAGGGGGAGATIYRVLLVGPRGSGRSVHGKLLAQTFGVVYCEFGLFLRSLHTEPADPPTQPGGLVSATQTRQPANMCHGAVSVS
ncbi:hypothetical protein JYU34_010757 [Plutella xylostella]|uniref:Uncharacterized protein n=1 Tax=Plutella xylostella TaxID=51655 RepID=A0ABQ7QGD8_PLUXY|nr:hypothetical protein JYU34_010757 [Plutella xylostella]